MQSPHAILQHLTSIFGTKNDMILQRIDISPSMMFLDFVKYRFIHIIQSHNPCAV